MAEEYTVEWGGWWRPIPVLLEQIGDPWAHELYTGSLLPRSVHPDRRPRQGVLVLDPNPALAPRDSELALILRMPPDPGGEEHRLRYPCLFLDDRHTVPGLHWEDWLVESRRWIAIRPDYEVLRATATRAEAIRHALQQRRQWEVPRLPEPEPEAPLEGDDLLAVEGLRYP